MGCACSGASSSGSSNWAYDDGEGGVTIFGSEVEAKAAMIRNGNKGSTKPA